MLGKSKLTRRYLTLLFSVLMVCWSFVSGADKNMARPLKPGEENRGPWWMRQTALTAEGQMPSLKNKSWWKKVAGLREGEELLWKEGKAEQENMLVRITQVTDKKGNQIEALVWIIDDDEDGSLKKGGDFHDDCYVYDFFRDGKVDFMVDYVDENRDGQADFMEVRYFDRGKLARAWVAFDYDGLGEMIRCQSPSDLISANLEFNLSGNKAYYFNRFEALVSSWVPDSIYPLASLDLDGDGLTEKLIRANLMPAVEPKQTAGEKAVLSSTAVDWPDLGSVEFSFDVDRANSAEVPYHYDLGLIITGQGKYNLEDYKNFSPLRRPPQELPAIPPAEVEKKLKDFKVNDVFFSWKECHLPTEDKILVLTEKEEQGLGWSWERFKPQASSPDVQKWNVRREVAEKLNSWPELYYSEFDQRIHLFKAKSGWWPIGYVAGLPRIGEIRYFDTDDDGYFDREEIYLSSSVRPVLVIDGHSRKVTKLSFNLESFSQYYTEQVLPGAIDRAEKFIQAMSEVLPYEIPEEFKTALRSSTGSDKRYLLDIYNLFSFINLRDHYLSLVNQKLFQSGEPDVSGHFYGDLYPGLFQKPGSTNQAMTSDQAWKIARLLSELEMAYSRGEDEKFLSLLKEIKKLKI